MIQALQTSKRFNLSNDRLELTDAGGTVQLHFRPATLLPLAGITWRLASYSAGTSPVDGTEISLAFRTDRTLTGIAGCNDYSADYEVNADQLILGPITHTEKACLEPDGVMNQETDYLNTIRQTASFTTTLTGLELLDSRGIPIAEYQFGGRIRNTAAGTG
ncbi:MAG: META domain-containing protein [Acidimicrobiia bacterium]|nr:META domain-containing protein [Acidimicrobiia bacterium]